MTIDPLSPILLLFEVVYIGVSVGLLILSGKVKSEWARAAIAGFALMTLSWRLLAVLPSWWLYFADGRLGWGGQGCVSLIGGTELLSCAKQTAKDLVVVIENAVVLGGFVVAFLMYQKKNPKQLASGENKPEPTFYR